MAPISSAPAAAASATPSDSLAPTASRANWSRPSASAPSGNQAWPYAGSTDIESAMREEPKPHRLRAVLAVGMGETVVEAQRIDEWKTQVATVVDDVRQHGRRVDGFRDLFRWRVGRQPRAGDRQRHQERRDDNCGNARPGVWTRARITNAPLPLDRQPPERGPIEGCRRRGRSNRPPRSRQLR